VRQAARRVEERPRHPEVHQESPTRFEPDNQILAATIDQRDPLAFELPRHLERVEWARQPWIGNLDPREGASLQPRREPAADGLDLGQLGHVPTVAAGRDSGTWFHEPSSRVTRRPRAAPAAPPER